jgi:hypothetical protein
VKSGGKSALRLLKQRSLRRTYATLGLTLRQSA